LSNLLPISLSGILLA